MSSKTIEINPSLFSIGGLSKKNRTKKNKSMSVPLISPNILKNKLLKRIKDHKNKETENLENNKKNLSSTTKIDNNSTDKKKMNNTNTYTDEFNDSIEYLQTLSKQTKIDSTNNTKKEAIQRKTIKNYNSMPVVNLELPEELQETFINTNNEIISSSNIVLPNYKLDNVPYGILKGGSKPTYRQWNRTHKNHEPNNNLLTNNQTSEREQRLNLLKQKLKQQSTIVTQPIQSHVQSIEVQPLQVQPLQTQVQPLQTQVQPIQIVTQPIQSQVQSTQVKSNLEEILLTKNLIQKPKQELIINNLSLNNQVIGREPEKIKTTKKLLKKTIHKKYTLGKSNIKRTVAVLLKDNNTRKNIINAQKDLKGKSVNDVKTYLRQHNLIKIGSNAPNDVIRKIYESAMLAGEITNNNKDIMLHNFIKEDS
jgi:hypothetical protein